MSFEASVEKVLSFRDEREWARFHSPKDLAISICLESAELLENFQWSGVDLESATRLDDMKDELADVAIYCIYLADRLGVSLPDIIDAKLVKNASKYPVSMSRGNSGKYNRQ